MDERDYLAGRFEEARPHLRGVAYRLLGSLSEADDAVQEAWLRLNRADTSDVANLDGWLTTVVARICLDLLRSRKARREESLDTQVSGPVVSGAGGSDPEQEALLADAVGLALLVVLERLNPTERLAFVLHDLFAVPFDEIAPVVGRSPEATRQLASRARRRVRGTTAMTDTDLAHQRTLVDAFLAASRNGDIAALMAVLDPDAILRAGGAGVPTGAPREVRGARKVAAQFAGRAVLARPALVDGVVGIVVAPRGRLLLVLRVTFAGDKITNIEAIADPTHLAHINVAVLSD